MGPIPEAYVKDVILQAGTVMVALLALIGTVVGSYLNYKSNQKAKKSAAENAANQRAAEQEEIARKAREEALMQKQEAAWDGFRRDIQEVRSAIDGLNKDVSVMGRRLDKFNIRMSARIATTEESIEKITQILARNARQNTEMLYMHRKTDERIKAVLDMELANFTFTKKTAKSLTSIGEQVAKSIDSDSAATVSDILDHLSESQDEFIKSIIQAQGEMTKTMNGFLETTEEDHIADIIRRRDAEELPDIESLDD